MAPRHRARARLERHVPRLAEPIERTPAHRLLEREVDTRPVRPLPSEGLRVPLEVEIKRMRPVSAGPNAPLLIRLVRHPYALMPGRLQRRSDVSRQRVSVLDRVPFPNAVRESEDRRAQLKPARPMREIQHRPVHREPPFRRREDPVPEPVFFDPGAEEGWL